MLGLIFWLLGTIPVQDSFPPDLEVECLEINTVWELDYNANRDPKYKVQKRIEQTIGWRLDQRGCLWADWWVWGHYKPIRKQGNYWIFWIQPTHGPSIRVKARYYKITDTWYDPEVLDREITPEEARAGLHPWTHIKTIELLYSR